MPERSRRDGEPDNKQCSKCATARPITAFGFRARNGLQVRKSQCDLCINAYHVFRRRACPETRARHLEQVRVQKKKLYDEVADLKRQPCVDCGKTFNPWQMQFDHVRGVKKGDIAHLVTRGSRKQVMDEIQKCDLVCANCHADRTYKRKRACGTAVSALA